MYETFKQDLKIFEKHLINNNLFLIWIVGYMLFFWFLTWFELKWLLILVLLYYVAIKFSISNVGEMVFRALHDARELATSKEILRLKPLYDEVYNRALEKSPYLDRDIKLYIIDSMEINAFAIGRRTIAITKGLIDSMSDDEIKSIIGHEFAHIANGDTVIGIVFSMGNTVFLLMVIMLRLVISIVEQQASNWIVSFFRGLVEGVFIFLTFLGTVLLSTNSRKREHNADMYSYELGYGESLVTALYKLYEYSLSTEKRVFERLQESHPRIPYRVGKLEERLEGDKGK